MGIFDSLKNNSVKLLVNNFIKLYGGKIIDMSIDKGAKTITTVVALEGETAPIHISMTGVSIITQNNASYLSFKKIIVDREWINTAINTLLPKYAPGNKIEIPGRFSGIVSLLI